MQFDWSISMQDQITLHRKIKTQCSYFIKQLNGFPWRIAWRLLESNIPRAWILNGTPLGIPLCT